MGETVIEVVHDEIGAVFVVTVIVEADTDLGEACRRHHEVPCRFGDSEGLFEGVEKGARGGGQCCREAAVGAETILQAADAGIEIGRKEVIGVAQQVAQKDPFTYADAAGHDMFGTDFVQYAQKDQRAGADRVETIFLDAVFGKFHDRCMGDLVDEFALLLGQVVLEGVDQFDGVVIVLHDRFGDGADRAADADGQLAAEGGWQRGEDPFDVGFRFFDGAFFVEKKFLEPHGAQIQGMGFDDTAVFDAGHVGGAAADVDGDAVFDGKEIDRRHASKPRLFVPVDHFDAKTQILFDPFEEKFAVGGVADGGGGDTKDFAGFVAFGDAQKFPQSPFGPFHRRFLKFSFLFVGPFGDPYPAAGFVEQMESKTAGALEHHHSRTVGSDVDDGGALGHGDARREGGRKMGR